MGYIGTVPELFRGCLGAVQGLSRVYLGAVWLTLTAAAT